MPARPLVLLRREGDAVGRAAALLAELHLHLQQHVPHAGEGGLHAGPDLQRLFVSGEVLRHYYCTHTLFSSQYLNVSNLVCHNYVFISNLFLFPIALRDGLF